MSGRFGPNRFRLILDCALVVAVILAVFAFHQPGQANAVTRSTINGDAHSGLQQEVGSGTLIETEVLSDTVVLSNEMIAGVIAAENAALTPPEYLIDLPLVTR
ncbi:MAG: hypothetical protein ACM3H7_04940 [Acidobacteriaceae bacterium]